MRKLIFIFFILLKLTLFSQEWDSTQLEKVYYFALRLMPSFEDFGQFYVVYMPSSAIEDGFSISHKEFILEASGRKYSLANPRKVDLFKIYNLSFKEVAFAMQNLWKLRYGVNPMLYSIRVQDTIGWAAYPCHPSSAQMSILKNYGVENFNSLILEKNLFRLFKDMNDPTWVENYKNAK